MFAVRYFCFVALTLSLTAKLICHETKDSNSGITNESLKKRNSKWNFEQPTVFASHEDTKSSSRVISLYSRTGKFLEILPSGRMRGTSYRESEDTHLEAEIFGISYRRFKRAKSAKYLAIDKYGKPYTRNFAAADTLFEARVEKNGWTRYRNVANGWMLAIKKNGRLKKAAKPSSNGRKHGKSMQFMTLFPEKTAWNKVYQL